MPQRLLACLALSLLTLWGCRSPRRPIYAVWVTRFAYRTPADVRAILANCAAAGFNTVLFQVRGNGTVFYPSRIEPWAEELGGKDPGFDPLALALAEAQRRGLALHAWVNVMPGWRGPTPPRNPRQLYNARPEWFWYDRHGRRQPLVHRVGRRRRAWYVSVNPCLPEVRRYLVTLFEELLARYPVTGLHLDYIRFPNEPVLPGEKVPDYPRDPRTLALFRAETGGDPDRDPELWNRWRTEQVTRLVRAIHRMVRRTRPTAVLSAAVGTDRARSLRHHRDGVAWLAQGYLDLAFPMNYRRTVAAYREGLRVWLPFRPRVVPGLWLDPSLDPRKGVAVWQGQIRYALETTGNFCLFSYGLLFETAAHRREGAAARERRRRRREGLLPFLQKVTAAPGRTAFSAPPQPRPDRPETPLGGAGRL